MSLLSLVDCIAELSLGSRGTPDQIEVNKTKHVMYWLYLVLFGNWNKYNKESQECQDRIQDDSRNEPEAVV